MKPFRVQLMIMLALGMSALPSIAQSPLIGSAVDAVSVDSMITDLRLLSGEDPVDVGNGPQYIVSRNKNQPGNPLAADWLQQRFTDLGYVPSVQVFSGGTGENIIAVKPGALHPDRKVVVCGHYDAMPGGPVAAPAADDDGSGTVAVLEAARVLAPFTFENTIVFALWDEEEQGLLGSEYWAGAAAANDDTIAAAVNMDAISYDSDGDRSMKVHTKPIANSVAIKDTALLVNTLYGIDLPITVQNPGATYSDHQAFWAEGFGAILIIENFELDGNPYYHTSNDLVEHIDQSYFLDLARLGIGTTAALAKPISGPTNLGTPLVRQQDVLRAWPNPMEGSVEVRLATAGGPATIALYDALGRSILEMNEGMLAPGKHAFQFDARTLAAGVYALRSTVGGVTTSLQLVRAR